MNVKELQPISLVGCVYELTVKVLARKMVKMLNKVVGKCQHAFIEG